MDHAVHDRRGGSLAAVGSRGEGLKFPCSLAVADFKRMILRAALLFPPPEEFRWTKPISREISFVQRAKFLLYQAYKMIGVLGLNTLSYRGDANLFRCRL